MRENPALAGTDKDDRHHIDIINRKRRQAAQPERLFWPPKTCRQDDRRFRAPVLKKDSLCFGELPASSLGDGVIERNNEIAARGGFKPRFDRIPRR